jgi:hypothetical protein
MNVRSDAWTLAHDTTLVENVLFHIRQGKTQLEAFRVTAIELGRTAPACGFRWNAVLRYEHLEDIKQARQERIVEEDYLRSRRQSTVKGIDFSSLYPRTVELSSAEPIWVRYHDEGLVTKVEILAGSPTPEQVLGGGYAILGSSSLNINLA